MTSETEIIPAVDVTPLIRSIRNQRVIVDSDLAPIYGVTTGNLNKAVKRNLHRFPPDFMFQLTGAEAEGLIFQIGRSKGP
jgi:ORF6N domain-containing protein